VAWVGPGTPHPDQHSYLNRLDQHLSGSQRHPNAPSVLFLTCLGAWTLFQRYVVSDQCRRVEVALLQVVENMLLRRARVICWCEDPPALGAAMVIWTTHLVDGTPVYLTRRGWSSPPHRVVAVGDNGQAEGFGESACGGTGSTPML